MTYRQPKHPQGQMITASTYSPHRQNMPTECGIDGGATGGGLGLGGGD